MTVFISAEANVSDTDAYVLHWHLHSSQTVSVYSCDTPTGEYRHLADVQANTFTVEGNSKLQRQYFLLKAANGDEYSVSQRRFDLDGAPNVRDFGGYKTQDGGLVPWGKFYRAGRLSKLSETDIRFFDSLNINDIFDFRRIVEVEKAPHNIGTKHSTTIHHLPISPGSHVGFMELLENGALSAQQCHQNMVAVYEDLALGQTDSYSRLLQHLLHSEGPLLVNCSAGKDRTGVAAAKILLLLGVDRSTIKEEYLLTARYFPNEAEYQHFEREFGGKNITREALAPLMTVQPQYIDAYFEAIDAHFPREQDYFEQVFGINTHQREAIKARHLV